jgi:hypothetical protein
MLTDEKIEAACNQYLDSIVDFVQSIRRKMQENKIELCSGLLDELEIARRYLQGVAEDWNIHED